jgi:hypothetical protein
MYGAHLPNFCLTPIDEIAGRTELIGLKTLFQGSDIKRKQVLNTGLGSSLKIGSNATEPRASEL